MLENFEKLLKQVDNRARFLSGVLSGDIKFINRKKKELRQEFMEKGFDPLPNEGQPAARGATGDTRERPDVDASDYDYLTSMPVSSLTEEYLEHLVELKKRFEIKVGLLRKAAPQCLKSEKEPALLGLLGSDYKYAQSGGDVMVDMAAKNSQVSEEAPRRQHKRSAAESLEASAVLMDDDEEDQAPELKDQSQEHTETECSQKQRKKQRKRRKKQRKESSETGAPKHCCHALDFRGHDKSEDGFLIEEIKRISSGLDGIEITHCNRDQSMVAPELAKLSLRDASVSLGTTVYRLL